MSPLVWIESPKNPYYTETIDESKMAGESPKTHLHVGENG